MTLLLIYDLSMVNDVTLLNLLQLASPALPVGAYSYSEGLETLVDAGIIDNQHSLRLWIEAELRYGAVRLEAAVMVRAYSHVQAGNWKTLSNWNGWLSAAKESEELRQQSWQMGQSLVRLLLSLQPHVDFGTSLEEIFEEVGLPCNYAIAFGVAAAYWRINTLEALLGYLHSWVSNLINAGVKLIPLGQTSGQQLLLCLHPALRCAAAEILALEDDALSSCGWGLALASMAHEVQYTRLFRS